MAYWLKSEVDEGIDEGSLQRLSSPAGYSLLELSYFLNLGNSPTKRPSRKEKINFLVDDPNFETFIPCCPLSTPGLLEAEENSALIGMIGAVKL